MDKYASLHKGINENDSGHKRELLEEEQPSSIKLTGKLNITDILNSPSTSIEVRNAVKEARNGKAVSVDKCILQFIRLNQTWRFS